MGAAEAELERRPSGGHSACHSPEQRGEGSRGPSCGARLGNKVTGLVGAGVSGAQPQPVLLLSACFLGLLCLVCGSRLYADLLRAQA